MTEDFNTIASQINLGLNALLRGDEDLAQEIWMSVILNSPVDQVDSRLKELIKRLEQITIELLQGKNYIAAKKCYEMALEIDSEFDNPTLNQILRWKENYHEICKEKGYKFTTDWFSYNIPIWNQVLKKFVGYPELSFLEVGSWEGRSTCWLLDNILTHESSTITCIDTFEGSIEHTPMGLSENVKSLENTFDYNIQQTGKANQVKKLVGFSRSWLHQLSKNSFDFYYIDGSHIAADVLEDTVMGWRLVKEGGIIIFDDYGWGLYKDQPLLHPKLAVDTFLTIFQDKVQVLYKDYQVICEKVKT